MGPKNSGQLAGHPGRLSTSIIPTNSTNENADTCCFFKYFCKFLPGLVFSVVGTALLFMKNSDTAVQGKMNLAGLIVLAVGIGLLAAPMLYHLFCPKNDIKIKTNKPKLVATPAPV